MIADSSMANSSTCLCKINVLPTSPLKNKLRIVLGKLFKNVNVLRGQSVD